MKKKYLSLLILLSMLASLLPTDIGYAADPITIALSTDGNSLNRSSFLSGELVTLGAGLILSGGNTTSYPNARFEITIDTGDADGNSNHGANTDAYLNMTSIQVTPREALGGATAMTIDKTSDPKKVKITYTLGMATAGMSWRPVISFAQKNFDTPDGYVNNIQATLYDQDGHVLAQSIPLPLTFRSTRPMAITRTIDNSSYDGYKVTAGESDVGSSIVKPTSARDVRFSYILTTNKPDVLAAVGIPLETYRSDKMGNRYYDYTITETLPADAFFDPAKNPAWTLSPDGKSVTLNTRVFIVGNLSPENSVMHNPFVQLQLSFPGVDVNDPTLRTSAASVDLRPSRVGSTPISINTAGPEPPDAAHAVTLTDEMTFQLYTLERQTQGGKVLAGSRDYFDILESKTDKPLWVVTLANLEDENIYNLVIRDYNLNADAKVEKIKYSRVVLAQTMAGAQTAIVGKLEYMDQGASTTFWMNI